MQQGKDKYVNR